MFIWRRRTEPIECPRIEPIPDGHTVVVQGQDLILNLLTRGWEDHPTQPLPRVVPSAAPLRSPLLTRGARWRTRNNRHAGRPGRPQ
jgi:hypothetical protein